MATSTPLLLAVKIALDVAAIATSAILACSVVFLVAQQVMQRRQRKAQDASTTSRQDITRP
jgi:hypothetical protein